MPFRDVVGHRRLIASPRPVDPARRAPAEPAVCRPRQRRHPRHGDRRRAGAQLSQPVAHCRATRSAGSTPRSSRCLRSVLHVHAHRAKHPPRRHRRRARRHRVDQDRTGPRCRGPILVPSVRGPSPRRDRRRCVGAGDGGAERAAENARGAAAVVGVHSRDRAARCAAAHSPLPPDSAEIRGQRAGGDRSRGARVAERVLARAAAGGEPGRRLEAAQDLLVNTGGRSGAQRP